MLFTRVKALQKTRPQRLGLNMSNRSAPVRASAASNWQWVLCDRLNGYISSKGKERLSFVWRNVSMLTLEVEPVRQIANCNSNHGHTEGLSPSIIHDGSVVNSSIQKNIYESLIREMRWRFLVRIEK